MTGNPILSRFWPYGSNFNPFFIPQSSIGLTYTRFGCTQKRFPNLPLKRQSSNVS